jgi:hypothetical protein
VKLRFNENGNNIDDWETPQYILDWVKSNYGEFFDPCPLRSSFDGLNIDWKPINFVIM